MKFKRVYAHTDFEFNELSQLAKFGFFLASVLVRSFSLEEQLATNSVTEEGRVCVCMGVRVAPLHDVVTRRDSPSPTTTSHTLERTPSLTLVTLQHNFGITHVHASLPIWRSFSL